MFSCPCPEVFTFSCKVILECLLHSSSHHLRPKFLVLQVQLSQNDHSPCCCPEVFSSPCHIIPMCLVLTKTRSTTQQSKHTWCIQMGQTCIAKKSTLLWRTIQHNDNLWFAVDGRKIKSPPMSAGTEIHTTVQCRIIIFPRHISRTPFNYDQPCHHIHQGMYSTNECTHHSPMYQCVCQFTSTAREQNMQE